MRYYLKITSYTGARSSSTTLAAETLEGARAIARQINGGPADKQNVEAIICVRVPTIAGQVLIPIDDLRDLRLDIARIISEMEKEGTLDTE